MVPTPEQVDAQLNAAQEQVDDGGSKFPGMSYEEGVANALRWAAHGTGDAPMDD